LNFCLVTVAAPELQAHADLKSRFDALTVAQEELQFRNRVVMALCAQVVYEREVMSQHIQAMEAQLMAAHHQTATAAPATAPSTAPASAQPATQVASAPVVAQPPAAQPIKASSLLTKEQTQKVLDVFQLFDTNKNGSIDQREVSVALLSLGFDPKKEEITKIFGDLDKDRSGKIEFNEFLNLIAPVILSQQAATVAAATAAQPTVTATRPLI
jgi:hypothetical protein